MNDAPGLMVVVKLQARTPAELIAGLTEVVAQLEADVERVLEAATVERACRRVRYSAATDPFAN